MTDDEVKAKLQSLERARLTKMVQAREDITKSTKDGEGTVAPLL